MNLIDRFRPRARTKSRLPAPLLSEDILQPNAPLSLEFPTSFLDLGERKSAPGRGHSFNLNRQSETSPKHQQQLMRSENPDRYERQARRGGFEPQDCRPVASHKPSNSKIPPQKGWVEVTKSDKFEVMGPSPPEYEKGKFIQRLQHDSQAASLGEPCGLVCSLCGKATGYSECSSKVGKRQSITCKGCEVKEWINPHSSVRLSTPANSKSISSDLRAYHETKTLKDATAQTRCGRCGRLKASSSVPPTAVVTMGTKATPKLVEQSQLEPGSDYTYAQAPLITGITQLADDDKFSDDVHTVSENGQATRTKSSNESHRFNSMRGQSSGLMMSQNEDSQRHAQSAFEGSVSRKSSELVHEAELFEDLPMHDTIIVSTAGVQINESRMNSSNYETALSRFKSLRGPSKMYMTCQEYL